MLILSGWGLVQKPLESSAVDGLDIPPSNIAQPELAGKAEVGSIISAKPGTWSGSPAPEVRTSLLVGGTVCRSPYLLAPDDDGKEIVVSDIASNAVGEGAMASLVAQAHYPAPHALGLPVGAAITSRNEPLIVDAGQFLALAEGGSWSASLWDGQTHAPCVVSGDGKVTVGGPGTVSVTYCNSGGSVTIVFVVVDDTKEEPPVYDGSFGTIAATAGAPFTFAAGAAFTGEALVFSAVGLVPGLNIDAATGEIAGTPTAAGSFAITVVATNAGGAASGTLKVTVAQPLPTAPVYDGSLQSEAVQLGVAFDLAAGRAFTGEALTFAAVGLAPGLVIDPATGTVSGTPTAEGGFAVTITATNAGGVASGAFSITVTKPGTGVPAAPSYDGCAADIMLTPGAAIKPIDMSVHFSGADLVYSASGLPAGLVIGKTTGVISGTPSGTSTASVTVTASNAGGTADAPFQIFLGATEPGGGGETPQPSGTFVGSTAMLIETDRATVDIGKEEAGREVYVFALVGGTEDAGLTVNGDAPNPGIVGTASYPMRAAQAYRATGLGGTTAEIALSGAADTEHVAVFRTVGYRPVGTYPWITARQAAGNATETVLNLVVPAGGAVLLLGKRYDQLSDSPAGTVIDESVARGLRGFWKNETGAEANVRFVFATSSVANEKYAAALILERA